MTNGHVGSVSFDDLTPSTNYTLCLYLEELNGTLSATNCTTFVSTDAYMARALFKFTRKLEPFELNRLLCFIVSTINSQIIYVMTLAGESCNPSGRLPAHYRYSYQG